MTKKLDRSEDDEIIVFKEKMLQWNASAHSKINEGIVSKQDWQIEHEGEPPQVIENEDAIENEDDDDDGYYIATVMKDHDYF